MLGSLEKAIIEPLTQNLPYLLSLMEDASKLDERQRLHERLTNAVTAQKEIQSLQELSRKK